MWSFGATGKVLKDVVAVGIGGCFLGPLFVHTVLVIPHIILFEVIIILLFKNKK